MDSLGYVPLLVGSCFPDQSDSRSLTDFYLGYRLESRTLPAIYGVLWSILTSPSPLWPWPEVTVVP